MWPTEIPKKSNKKNPIARFSNLKTTYCVCQKLTPCESVSIARISTISVANAVSAESQLLIA